MKKITQTIFNGLLILCFINITFKSLAQISEDGIPPSFTNLTLQKINFPTVKLIPPDIVKLNAEDNLLEQQKIKKPPRMAVSIPVDINMDNSGTWITLNNGDRIWILCIEAPDALALGTYYDNFYLPDGTELYLYNEDKTQVIGAFTSKNNHESGLFATEFIQGSKTYIEYYQPAMVSSSPIFHINEIAYGYRLIHFPFLKTKEFGDSQACEVNVNCPQGSNWQDQKRGIARISIKIGSYYYWCSGSLINNVKEDCTPYFLTACHCGDGASTSDLNQWVFYFNWEAPGCTTPTTSPSWKTMTGASFKATDGNEGNNGSDFYLIKLNNTPPASYNLYLNGWSRSTTPSPSGVSIHHPAADIKKISTYSTTLTSGSWGATNSHWVVKWSSGVTEEGSSGSPLFNNSKQLIGSLTGGMSACTINGAGSGTGPNEPDYYGKFSYSWANNGTVASKRLKDWLDPNNTNVTAINGRYACQNVSINEQQNNNQINLFPNPAKDYIVINMGNDPNLKDTRISISDIVGNIIATFMVTETFPNMIKLDISNYAPGIYFIKIDNQKNIITKKITKI